MKQRASQILVTGIIILLAPFILLAWNSSVNAEGLCLCTSRSINSKTCASNGASCVGFCRGPSSYSSGYNGCAGAKEVSAKEGWQSMGVKVNSGETVHVKHTIGKWNGNVRLDQWHGADGPTNDVWKAPAGYPLPGVDENCLIGRIGNKVFFVGSNIQYTAKNSGVLHLRMNDTGFHDNDGKLFVKITIH